MDQENKEYLFVLDFGVKGGKVHIFPIVKGLDSESVEEYLTTNLEFNIGEIQWLIKSNKDIHSHC